MKPLWQNVEQEAPDKLAAGEGHCAVPRLSVAAVILVAEGWCRTGTEISNPFPSSGEMLWGGRRGWQFRRLHQSMECRDAPAERFEQVPRAPGPRQDDHCRRRAEPVELAGCFPA